MIFKATVTRLASLSGNFFMDCENKVIKSVNTSRSTPATVSCAGCYICIQFHVFYHGVSAELQFVIKSKYISYHNSIYIISFYIITYIIQDRHKSKMHHSKCQSPTKFTIIHYYNYSLIIEMNQQ